MHFLPRVVFKVNFRFSVFILLVLFGLLLGPLVRPVSAGSIYLSPGSRSVAPGSTFSLGVRASMGGDLVNAAEANLSYPTDKLDFVSISAGGSGFPIDAASGGGGGGIRLSRGVIGQGVSGDKLIGTVTFRAKSAGTATIGVSGSLVRGADQANVFSGGAGATITISGNAQSTQTGTTQKKPVVTSTSPTPTATPLQITNISVTNVGYNKATITFTTDKATIALVEYGLTNQYGLTSQETKATTTHAIPLTSTLLSPGTTYHFRIKGATTAQTGESADMTFTTKGITVEVTLTNSDNSPIANQKVELISPSQKVNATTDAQGLVTFTNLSATQHTLVAEIAGKKIVETFSVTAPSEKELSSDLLPNQKVQVKVAGAQIAPQNPFLWILVALGIIVVLLFVTVFFILRRRKTPPSQPTIVTQTMVPGTNRW